jgi:hypothetical protein
MKHDLDNLMQTAFLRIELANSEGDPIMSGWLPDAKEAWQEQQAAYHALLSALKDIANYNWKSHGADAVKVLNENATIARAAIFKATGELP